MAISIYPANSNNFLQWYPLNDALPLSPTLSIISEPKKGFSSAFGSIEEKRKLEMITTLGAIKFYINLDTPLTSALPLGCHLLNNQNQIVTSNFCTPQLLNLDGTNYHIYCEDANFTAQTEGQRKLLIYNTGTNTALYLSDAFMVKTSASDYAKVTFRNSFDFNQFYYSLIPTFYQVFHLPDVKELESNLEKKINQYETVAAQMPVKTLAQVMPFLKLRFYDYDKNKHLAIQTMLMHSDLEINELAIEAGGNDYETDQTNTREHWLYNADVKVYLKDNSFNAKLC